MLLSEFATFPNGLVEGPGGSLYRSNQGISVAAGDGQILRIVRDRCVPPRTLRTCGEGYADQPSVLRTCSEFLTSFTPPTFFANSEARMRASSESTEPLSCTVPLKVSTLI